METRGVTLIPPTLLLSWIIYYPNDYGYKLLL